MCCFEGITCCQSVHRPVSSATPLALLSDYMSKKQQDNIYKSEGNVDSLVSLLISCLVLLLYPF